MADHIVVAVAPDGIVEHLKRHKPTFGLEERMRMVGECSLVDEVLSGDTRLQSYDVVMMVQPTLIGFGYDQGELAEDLRSWLQKNAPHIETVKLQAFEPHIHKSSLL